MLMLLLSELHALLRLLLLGCRGDLPLAELGEVLNELLEAATDKVDILVTLLEKDLSYLGTLTLVTHVDHYKFVRRVLETEELWDQLVTTDVWSRVVKGLLDVAKHIILGLPHVQEQELSILCNTKHLSCIGYSRSLGNTSLMTHY